MDNPLTPNKIQRLMHLAEDKSFNVPRRLHHNEENFKSHTINPVVMNKTTAESSSGIIDLERVEGFGESGLGDFSLSKSTAFNPGEMTGRSTGADEMNVKPVPLGRHSLALESITSQMDKQTSEIQDIMRHSIASNYSFHSKRDLTADEASLVAREAPLPMQNITHTQFTETSMNNSNLSMGAYFKNRCPEFGKILAKTDSPDKLYLPPILDASPAKSLSSKVDGNSQKIDQNLDCIPVRQPRNTDDVPEKQNNLTKADHSVALQNEPSCSKTDKQEMFYMSQVLDKPKYVQISLDSSTRECNKVAKPMHEHNLIMKLQNSLRLMSDDTEGSTENSLSISKIADFLGKQSNVSVTDMLLYNNQKKHLMKKQPLTELHMNIPEKKLNTDVQVTHLKDTKKTETASTSSSVNTVLESHKYKLKDVPEIVLTQHTLREEINEIDDSKSKRNTRSKSPSSKSHSTLSTVQENFTSFKSADSPLHTSKGEPNTSHVPSPNIVYKQLDKSVDWDEVMREKRMKQEGLAKEQWADVVTTAANGYVGVSVPVTLTVTTLTDSWLTAKLQFDDVPNNGKDLTIEIPRQPLLLSPGKSERIIINITSNVELQGTLQFTLFLKDASVDCDIEQRGEIEVNIRLPVIQAMSCDGINKVVFQPIQETTALIKSFVLLSDCPVDLQLALSVVEGDSMFAIKTVQEIKKSDVNKVLLERQGSTDDVQGKVKNKTINKQLCRLSSGNAIRVTIKFSAPKLAELQIVEPIVTFNGLLHVSLIGVNTLLRKIDLISVVGTVNLTINAPTNKLQLTNEPTNIELINDGSIPATWYVKFKTNAPDSFPFKISPSKFDIRPGGSRTVTLMYTGAGDGVHEATVTFEDVATGNKKSIDIIGGYEKPKSFPIKTNYCTMSWVRPGRKELSLKNATDKKIYIRCQILGEGFSIDLPRESRGAYSVPFGPCECRPLPIIFTPTSNVPQKAVLHIVSDKSNEFSRKIPLYGCASGEAMRWSGLVTYGETALVRAVSRTPINLELYNKSSTAAFVCARVHFNLQYMCVANTSQLLGARRVVGGRARHSVALRVDWPRLERRAREPQAATALATLTVLTGAEFTRRRILKIVRDESNGELDTSLLPDHLKVLANKYEGEDPSMDRMLADFQETRASLNELIGGLQEMTAQIDLPQDYSDENTIIISDDTVIEHHTLCD